jgi:hypothetical protein
MVVGNCIRAGLAGLLAAAGPACGGIGLPRSATDGGASADGSAEGEGDDRPGRPDAGGPLVDGGVAGDVDGGFETSPDAGIAAVPAWGPPTMLGQINSPAEDAHPSMSGNRLKVCFTSSRPGSSLADIWCAVRSQTAAAFGAPVRQTLINSAGVDWMPALSSDGNEMFFSSDRAGHYDLYRATWDGTQFAGPQAVTALNSSRSETGPSLSGDGLTVVFDSDRAGASGANDLYVATRPSVAAGFQPPTSIVAVNTDALDQEAGVSPDLAFLTLCSDRPARDQVFFLWIARRDGTTWAAPERLSLDEAGGQSSCGPALLSDGSLLFHSDRAGGLGASDIYIALPLAQ